MPHPGLTDVVTPLYARLIGAMWPVMERTTTHTWQGGENLPAGGFVVAANHISNVDHFPLGHFLVAHSRAPHFLAKRSLFRIPVLRRLMTGTGQFPVDRYSAAASDSLSAAQQAVHEGKCVVIYPEGTISLDPKLWPMVGKTGAARLALQTGCPLVPVVVWGTQEILRPYVGHWIPKLVPARHVQVVAGKAIKLDDLKSRGTDPEVAHIATARLMDALSELLATVRHEQPPVQRFDPRRARNLD